MKNVYFDFFDYKEFVSGFTRVTRRLFFYERQCDVIFRIFRLFFARLSTLIGSEKPKSRKSNSQQDSILPYLSISCYGIYNPAIC